MEKRLKQLNSLKNISLSEAERGVIRAHVAYLINTIPVKQPSRIASIFSSGIQHTIRIALSTSMLVFLVGGSVGAVADNALPGDPLYAFKINVNEQVKGMFLNTPEERIAYQKGRIDSRVAEIKTLADSKTLTKEKQVAVQKAIDTHIEKISTDLDSLSTTSPSVALDITTGIEASLKENKDNLEKSIEPSTMSLMATSTEQVNDGNTGVEDALKAADSTLQKVADQEVKIIAKEIDSIISSVDETAPATTTNSETTTPPDEVTPVEP